MSTNVHIDNNDDLDPEELGLAKRSELAQLDSGSFAIVPSVSKQKELKAKKQRVTYSRELVDKIADKLAMDMSFPEIANTYEWAPTAETMRQWQLRDPYAQQTWLAARTELLEERKLDKINELKKVNLDEMMDKVQEKSMHFSMKNTLFKAKVEQVYNNIELLKWELATAFPEKYGTRVNSFDVNKDNGLKQRPLSELVNEVIEMAEQMKSLGLNTAKPEDNVTINVNVEQQTVYDIKPDEKG